MQAKDPIFDAQFDWHIVIADLSMVRAPKKRCLPITYSSTSELVIKGYEIALNAPAGPRTVRIYRSPKGQDISYCDAGGASPCPNNCAGNCICDPNFHVYNSKGQPLEILA